MPKHFHAIPTFKLKSHSTYMQPPELPEVTHINDSALSVMVDFKYHTPPTISAHKSIDEAKLEMQIYHLPLLLVIDHEKSVIGIVSADDILGEKPVMVSQERRIPRSEIEVEMVMVPFKNITAISADDLTHVKVGHIIQTFRETRQLILLVIEAQELRGLFSASVISRQLDKDINQILSEFEPIESLQHDPTHPI